MRHFLWIDRNVFLITAAAKARDTIADAKALTLAPTFTTTPTVSWPRTFPSVAVAQG
ncbi:MAG: hypothetical protein IJX39_00070 [Clostridia bacterium]|nr:hypothetical protein [Clostridia bacterium]